MPERKTFSMLGTYLFFLLVCFASGSIGASANTLGGETSLLGKDCPEIMGKDFDGVEFHIPARAKGRIEVLNFWGIRCASCLEEMPKLDEMNRRYRDRGLSIYGVNVDGASASILSGMLKKMDLSVSYRLLPDTDFTIMDSFHVLAAPLTVIIDDGGKVVFRHEGYEAGDENIIAGRIEELLPDGRQ